MTVITDSETRPSVLPGAVQTRCRHGTRVSLTYGIISDHKNLQWSFLTALCHLAVYLGRGAGLRREAVTVDMYSGGGNPGHMTVK